MDSPCSSISFLLSLGPPGVDNGILIFDEVWIPRDSLLDQRVVPPYLTSCVCDLIASSPGPGSWPPGLQVRALFSLPLLLSC